MSSAQCKYCNHCKQNGRMQTQQNREGRKKYYCEHPETENIMDGSYPINNFIGFGTMTYESPLALKTTKRWCPLAKK